jgi:hypothetical protein
MFSDLVVGQGVYLRHCEDWWELQTKRRNNSRRAISPQDVEAGGAGGGGGSKAQPLGMEALTGDSTCARKRFSARSAECNMPVAYIRRFDRQ